MVIISRGPGDIPADDILLLQNFHNLKIQIADFSIKNINFQHNLIYIYAVP